MPDPRPISEKTHMLESMRKIVTFLTDQGYEEPISLKTLQSPAIKVYASILQFLFRRIDPQFTFKGQFDEEIPNMFRMLDYPIAIQKGELKVISQHHWPRLLAALSWYKYLSLHLCCIFLKKNAFFERLVDLVQWDLTKAVQQEDPLETEDTEGIFFEYLSASYRQFMDNIDDTSELDAKFMGQFEDKNRQIEQECTQLERANAVLQKDISRLEQQASQLPAFRKQKGMLQEDIVKLTEFVASLEEYEVKVQRKMATNEKDLAAKKKRLEALQKEKESLQTRLSAQEASGIDCAKMMREQSEFEEQLTKLRQKREMARQMRGEQEIQMQKLLEVVESELFRYNELSMRLRLLPASANTKMPEVSFDLGFKSHADADEMVSGDLAKVIKPALKSLRVQLTAANRANGAELQALKEVFSKKKKKKKEKECLVTN
jgi:kinetochore protein NDC80